MERRGHNAIPIAGTRRCSFGATHAKADRWSGAPCLRRLRKRSRTSSDISPREKIDFSTLRLDLGASSPFHKAVYDATPPSAGAPSRPMARLPVTSDRHAPRARFGHALSSRNPIAVIIPCHRILAAGEKSADFPPMAAQARRRACLKSKARVLAKGPPQILTFLRAVIRVSRNAAFRNSITQGDDARLCFASSSSTSAFLTRNFNARLHDLIVSLHKSVARHATFGARGRSMGLRSFMARGSPIRPHR